MESSGREIWEISSFTFSYDSAIEKCSWNDQRMFGEYDVTRTSEVDKTGGWRQIVMHFGKH